MELHQTPVRGPALPRASTGSPDRTGRLMKNRLTRIARSLDWVEAQCERIGGELDALHRRADQLRGERQMLRDVLDRTGGRG